MIKVFIADDHAVVRKGVEQIFAETPDIRVVGEAGTGQDVLDAAKKPNFDVLILDISMPVRGGMDVLTELKRMGVRFPVLILSIHPEDQYGVRAVKSGAAGYITKESIPEELVIAVRKVASGGKYASPELVERLMRTVSGDQEPLHASLSNREFQVLRMIGSGMSVTEIAKELALSPKTVSSFRSRILDKMHLRNNADIIRYVVKAELAD